MVTSLASNVDSLIAINLTLKIHNHKMPQSEAMSYDTGCNTQQLWVVVAGLLLLMLTHVCMDGGTTVHTHR